MPVPREWAFGHQLIAWRDAFYAIAAPESRDTKLALRDPQTRNDRLQGELRRKEKALAEATAWLALQKMFQALWADEDS